MGKCKLGLIWHITTSQFDILVPWLWTYIGTVFKLWDIYPDDSEGIYINFKKIIIGMVI